MRPQAYTGSNPHTEHIHVSIKHTSTAERSSRRWIAEEDANMPDPRISDNDIKQWKSAYNFLTNYGKGETQFQKDITAKLDEIIAKLAATEPTPEG
jgi:hypothetical protein